MREEQFRNRVYWAMFLFSVLVIWIHSYNGELFLGLTGQATAVDRIQRFIGDSVGQMAVPGFFMISGYLFYRGFTPDQLPRKWRSRISGVLVPYFLWNFLYYAAYIVATRLPVISRLAGKSPIPFNLGELGNALLFFNYNPVFWYLYQLILLVCLAPVIYCLVRHQTVAAVSGAVLCLMIWKGWDIPLVNEDALLYYGAAAWAGLHRQGAAAFAEETDLKSWGKGAGAAAVLWVVALIFGGSGGVLYQNPLKTVLIRLAMSWLFWLCLGKLALPPAREWMKENFFLYAIHFAWVRLLNKSAAWLFPGSGAAALTLYLLMPVLVTAFSCGMVLVLRRLCPGVLSLLTGGRSSAGRKTNVN